MLVMSWLHKSEARVEGWLFMYMKKRNDMEAGGRE